MIKLKIVNCKKVLKNKVVLKLKIKYDLFLKLKKKTFTLINFDTIKTIKYNNNDDPGLIKLCCGIV